MNIENLAIYSLLIIFVILFTACPGGYGYKYNHGKIPEEVTNFEEINSKYDDYNISAPFIRDVFPLIFSSNRNSLGNQFDYIYKLIAVNFDKETAEFSVYNEINIDLDIANRYSNITSLLHKVNSPQNEYGPYLIDIYPEISRQYGYVLVYTYEVNNNMDIRFYYDTENFKSDSTLEVKWVNTGYNEGYPCFYQDYTKMVYCSDENGNFDIYEISTGIDSISYRSNNFDSLLINSLSDTRERQKTLLSVVSSPADDKCPFIDFNFNIMVFASNREGGYGGYDLYYSKFENGKWSKPVNFGEKINSPYDEYRPILRKGYGFDNSFLMFSSNRPGGKGGFDLYYVGVDL